MTSTPWRMACSVAASAEARSESEALDLGDGQALVTQRLEVVGLVGQALGEDEVEGVVGCGGPEVAGAGVERLQVEGGDVRAGDMLGQVCGAEHQTAVDSLHAQDHAIEA